MHAATIVVCSFSFFLSFISCIHTLNHSSPHLIQFLISPNSVLIIPIVSLSSSSSLVFQCLVFSVLCFCLGHLLFLTCILLILVFFFFSLKSYFFSIHISFLFLLTRLCLCVVLFLACHFFLFLPLYILHLWPLFLAHFSAFLFPLSLVLLVTEAVPWLTPSSSMQMTLTQVNSNVTRSHSSPHSLEVMGVQLYT